MGARASVAGTAASFKRHVLPASRCPIRCAFSYMVANFVPWSAADGEAPELTIEAWRRHVAELQVLACLHSDREEDPQDGDSDERRDELAAAKAARLRAAGRLYEIENLLDAFKVDREVRDTA